MENTNQPTSEATPATHNPNALQTWICEATATTTFEVEAATREEAQRMAQEDENIDFRDAGFSCDVIGVHTPNGDDDRVNFPAKGDAPDLSAVPVDALISEIYRRHHKGECVALVITPDDVSEYWECDDSGATSPASRVPENGEEMKALRYAFDHWLDRGGYTEVMQTLRDAWNDEQARQLDAQEGKGDAK